MNNNSHPNLLRQGQSILNTFLLSLIFCFIIHPAITFSYLDAPIRESLFGRLAFVGLLPINILFLAGLLGVFVEMAAGENELFSMSRFWSNVRHYWLMIFWLSLIPVFLHMLMVSLMPVSTMTLQDVFASVQILLAYWAARWIVRDKYLSKETSKRKIMLAPGDGIALGLVALIDLGLYHLPAIVQFEAIDISRFTILLSRYTGMLLFLMLVQKHLDAYADVLPDHRFSKEIVLINPANLGLWAGMGSLIYRLYPAVFVVIRALTPPDYRFREYNKVYWHKRYARPGQLVCITCFTSNCAEAYRIARDCKEAGSIVVMGGPHVTYFPEEALEFCDSVVVGEAEGTWRQIVADYEKGELKEKYSAVTTDEDRDFVHQRMLSFSPELIKSYLETTRGCKFKCKFCTIPGIGGGKMVSKPIFELVELLKRVKTKYDSVMFIDNNIYSDPGYAKALFKELKPLKLKWKTMCTIDIAKNTEVLQLARESGIDSIMIGYEVPTYSTESRQRGKFGLTKKYSEFTKIIKQQGISIKGNFIFGWEDDTWFSLIPLWKYCFTLLPSFTIICVLTPMPGAAMYQEVLDDNSLINLNWRHFDCRSLIMKHPHLSPTLMSAFMPLISGFYFFTASLVGILLMVIAVVAIAASYFL